MAEARFVLAASALQDELKAASEVPVASPTAVGPPLPVASGAPATPTPATLAALPVGGGGMTSSPLLPMPDASGRTSSASRPPPPAVAALWSSLAHMRSVPMPTEIIASASALEQWMMERSEPALHPNACSDAAAAALLNLRGPSSVDQSSDRPGVLPAMRRGSAGSTAVIQRAPSLLAPPPSGTPEVASDSFLQQWILANRGASGLFPSVDAAVIGHTLSAGVGLPPRCSADAALAPAISLGARGRGRPRVRTRSTVGVPVGTSSLRLLLPAPLAAPNALGSESRAAVVPAEPTKAVEATGNAGRPSMSWSKNVSFDQMTRSGQSRRWKKTGAIAAALTALKTVGAVTAGG